MSSIVRPRLLEDLAGRRDRALEHRDGVGTGNGERVEAGPGLHAQLLGLVLAHDQHARGAVGDLRGVAGGDRAVLLERRLELGERLGGGALADALVGAELLLRAVEIDDDRDDLVVEAALVAGDRGALLALGAERVEVVAGEAVLLGDHLGADALRGQAGVGVAVELRLREREAHALDDRRAHRRAGHDLDAGGDDDVVRAGDDALRGEVHRLLAGAALAIDGGGGHRFGPAGGEDGVAADVERLLTDLHHATHDHVVDEFGVEVVALLEGLEHLGGEGGGMPVLELSVALAAGGADGVDDDGFGHGSLLLFGGSMAGVVRDGRATDAASSSGGLAMTDCRLCWRRVITHARA